MIYSLNQAEYDELMQMEKHFLNAYEPIILGSPRTKWSRELFAKDFNKEKFILDYNRGKIEFKYTFNKRYRTSIVLLRFDSWGRHTNPDGKTFDGPHVHLYTESFGDRFAYPVDEIKVTDSDREADVLDKIYRYCNITSSPPIQLTMI